MKALLEAVRALLACDHPEIVTVGSSNPNEVEQRCRVCGAVGTFSAQTGRAVDPSRSWKQPAQVALLDACERAAAGTLRDLAGRLGEGTKASEELAYALEAAAGTLRTEQRSVEPEWLEELARAVRDFGAALDAETRSCVAELGEWGPEQGSRTHCKAPEGAGGSRQSQPPPCVAKSA
jgi:hypothetical protein